MPGAGKQVSLEEQVAVLAECGVRLVPGVPVEALLDRWHRKAFESDPYKFAMNVMGGKTEAQRDAGETGYLSDDVWYFDTECIYQPGDYARIIERMVQLAQGDLPLEDIADRVDPEEAVAWATFKYQGVAYRWQAAVDDDWVDPQIFTILVELLRRTGSDRRFTYLDLGGQDCVLGCATPEQREQLCQRTGLAVEWLD